MIPKKIEAQVDRKATTPKVEPDKKKRSATRLPTKDTHVGHLILKHLSDISQDWWEEILLMLHSDNVLDRKFALVELNKLQIKAMPGSIDPSVGNNVIINIVNYGNKDSAQFHAQAIPATVIESD